MANDFNDFGGIPFLDKLKMLADYAPLLSKLQAIIATDDAHEQALRVIEAAKWAAGKTDTPDDNEALHHIEAVLKTKEGKDLFHWLVEKVQENGGDSR